MVHSVPSGFAFMVENEARCKILLENNDKKISAAGVRIKDPSHLVGLWMARVPMTLKNWLDAKIVRRYGDQINVLRHPLNPFLGPSV